MWWRQDAGESLEVEAGQARAGGGGDGGGGGGGGGRGGVQDFGFEGNGATRQRGGAGRDTLLARKREQYLGAQ